MVDMRSLEHDLKEAFIRVVHGQMNKAIPENPITRDEYREMYLNNVELRVNVDSLVYGVLNLVEKNMKD